MKKLIIVRHGEYGFDRTLNDKGRKQISQLAEKLKAIVNGELVKLFTSPAPRAKQSADIIGQALGVIPQEERIFWSGEFREDIPRAYAFIDANQGIAEIIVLVTHLEYAQDLPRHYCRKEFGLEHNQEKIGTGQGYVVDCENETLERV